LKKKQKITKKAIFLNGNLYGIDLENSSLNTIDATDGAGTFIGSVGLDLMYAQDIGFDRINNILYGTLYDTASGLYTINLDTGAATIIGSTIGDEMVGLGIPY
jgi:hypothetical protein